jgi:hypothetical protein
MDAPARQVEIKQKALGNEGLFLYQTLPTPKPVKPPNHPKTARTPITTGDLYFQNLA